jgi:hypothetical protein
MKMKTLNEVLGAFKQDSHTVRLCDAIFGVVPGAPKFAFYNTLEGAVARVAGGDPAILKAAQDLAASDEMRKALWVTDALDSADAGISIYTGLRNLLILVSGEKKGRRTFEADPGQATDAALKAAGLAYMVYKMFPGSVAEKVKAFRETPAGQELAIYYGVAEIALPFTDNLVESGANVITRLLAAKKDEVAAKFTALGAGEELRQAAGVAEQLAGPLGSCADEAKNHTPTLMEKIKANLPSGATIANVADSSTGMLATAVDLLPVWRFLGGRAVAEACALRAKKELIPSA